MSLVRVQLPEPRFPQISAVFLYFCYGNSFRYKSPKNVKKTPFLNTKLYICYTDFLGTAFLSHLNQRNINKSNTFRRFAKNQSNIFLVRMSRLYNFYIFTEKSTHYTFATHGLNRPYVGF